MSQKDYGRQPHTSSKRYPDFIRTKSAKQIWDRFTESYPNLSEFTRNSSTFLNSAERAVVRFIKQSVLKKPYENSDPYREMESDWEGLPGFRRTDTDHPWNMEYPGFEGDIEQPAICIFDLESDACYCKEAKIPITVHGSEPIYHVQTTMNDDPATAITDEVGYGTNTVTFNLYAGAGESGPITIEASMTCVEGLTGSSNVNLPECGDTDCPIWFITLTRGDGATVDEAMLVNFYAKGVNSSILHTLDYTYLGAGEWKVWITGANGFDPGSIYWLSYRTKIGTDNDATDTQYPSRYQDADKEQGGDAVTYGVLDDTTAYYEVTTEWDTTPIAWDDFTTYELGTTGPGMGEEVNPCDGVVHDQFIGLTGSDVNDPIGTWRMMKDGSSIRWETVVKSNLEYTVRMFSVGNTARRVTARGMMDAESAVCFDLDCSEPTPDNNCQCDFSGFQTTTTDCVDVFVWFCENVDVVEAVSDGLDADTYNLDNTSAHANFASYEDSVLIEAPDVNGKTHYFEYSVSADDIPFEWEDDECVGSPNCGDGNPPSTCCDYECLAMWCGIDNTSATHNSSIALGLTITGVTVY